MGKTAPPRPRDGLVRTLGVLVAASGLVIVVVATVAGLVGNAGHDEALPGGVLGISLLVLGMETVKHPRDRRTPMLAPVLHQVLSRRDPPGPPGSSGPP